MGYASVASYVGLVLLSGQEYQSRNADHERRPVAGSLLDAVLIFVNESCPRHPRLCSISIVGKNGRFWRICYERCYVV